ncbi:MAG: STAS domain-containing protein [Planctomycetales bacterium]|nr:STAS domain-containing protein [Planctomycetales bacterium]
MPEAPIAEAVGDVLVLRPAAEHLKLEAAQAIAALLVEPRFKDVKKVLVVLERVRYVDSTGISLLVRMGSERALRLSNLSARIQSVLGGLKMLSLFQIHASEAEALAAFGVRR